jgi:hypothetical protein
MNIEQELSELYQQVSEAQASICDNIGVVDSAASAAFDFAYELEDSEDESISEEHIDRIRAIADLLQDAVNAIEELDGILIRAEDEIQDLECDLEEV